MFWKMGGTIRLVKYNRFLNKTKDPFAVVVMTINWG